jgi:sodium/potassium-transporting ATPase subunit alpha
MKINNLAEKEVLLSLATFEQGLTEAEVRKRLLEFGPNEIREVKRKSFVLKFFEQFTHFLAILLWVGAGFSFLSEYLHPGEGMLTLGLAIIGVIFINGLFTFVQEYRAEKSIEKLKLLLPFSVKVLRDGKEREAPAAEVVPGDIILLSEGDKVPADSRLIATSSLMVDNAPLTGESEAVPLSQEPSEGELSTTESRNIAFAGTTVVSGSGTAVVFATGMRTEFGRIAQLTSAVEPGLSPLQKEIAKVSRIIAFLAATTSIIFFIAGRIIGMAFWENFIFAIGLIVALVPEGLLPTVTLSLAIGSQRMAKKKALIKTLTAVETLGSVTVICTDKTGTITQNKMEVKKIWCNGNVADISECRDAKPEMLYTIAYLCNNARLNEGQYRGDPTETALLKAVKEADGDVSSERISEIPFDSERKRMTTLNRVNGKVFSFTKGAMETVMPLCSRALIDGKKIPFDDDLRKKIIASYHSLMDRGLRVLSFSYKEMELKNNADVPKDSLETDMIFAGMMALEDPPRPEVAGAIQKCREAGIKVIMITGDGSRTAVAIAREIGLVGPDPVVIEGQAFANLGDRELGQKLSEKEIIFARMTPKYKMRVVSILKEQGERVAVTGDGVNDAPALKKADIGIAMGIAGTDVAKEAADMVLLDDNFATIVNAVEEGRAVFENIRKFISYIFASNVAELVPFLVYALFRVPLPLTIIQILSIDLGTDMLPALALGAERPTRDLMKLPPRGKKERLLNAKLLSRAYLFLGPLEAAAGLFGFFYVLTSGGWHGGEMLSSNSILYMQATTACLTGIVVTQVANVFACRSFRESVFGIGFFSNTYIFFGIAVEILLQLFIVYTDWGNLIFSTAPVPLRIWMFLMPFAVALFAAEELRKMAAKVVFRTSS